VKFFAILRASHPPRRRISRRMAAFKFIGSKPLLRRTNGVASSSLLLQLRLVARRTLARVHFVAPSWPLQVRSDSTLRLLFRRTPLGLFRTNLAGLGWAGSSRLINLLVVHLAASAASRCSSLLNQGPLRASNTALGLNTFLLRPTAFHYAWPQRSGGKTARDLIDDSGLFFSDLRFEAFLFFFVAIALLRCIPASQGDSAIRRPNVSPQAKTTDHRYAWTYITRSTRYGTVWRARRC
jgi:hypothetical protein